MLSPLSYAAPVELGTLVKQTISAQGKGTLPWSFLASANSPVTWQTQGVNGNGGRIGSVIISVGGFVPQVLRQNLEPTPWEITLSGDKFGARVVTLSNDGCFGINSISKGCSEKLTNIGASLNQAGLTATPACEFGPGDAHTKVFTVAAKGKPPLFLAMSVNGGSAGVTVDISLFIHSGDGASTLEHATSICSVLFAHGYGKDSNNFYSYSHLHSKQ